MSASIESVLLKKIKCLVLKDWLDGDIEALNADTILSKAAAIVYPFRDDIVVCNDNNIISRFGSLKNILDSVMSHCKKRYEMLDTYSYESLILYFRNEWATRLTASQKRLLCNGISIITNVGEDGYVSIKGEEKVWKAIINNGFEELNAQYGDAEYVPNSFATTSYKDEPQTSLVSSSKQMSIADEELNSFWGSIISNESFLDKMPFVWKLKMSHSNYCQLKELLRNTYLTYGSKKQRFLDNHSEKLFVYVAEWYRREYSAKGDNALNDISINIQAKEIFENSKCKRWSEYVYSGDDNACWLYSLYVLGGLPTNYVSYSITQLYDSIFAAINGDVDTLNAEPNFNNTAFKESLKSENGSLRQFVDSILDGDLPFSESDIELDVVKRFIENINEGYKRSWKDKFDLVWIVNYDGSEMYGCRKLRILFKPEEPGKLQKKISYKRMKDSWNMIGIEKLPSFKLKCSINGLESFLLTKFSNQWNNYFVGWMTENYIDVPRKNIPSTYINSIDILLEYELPDGNTKTIDIQREEYKDHYIQFYPTNELFEWSSALKYGYESAVVFRTMLQTENASFLKFSEAEESDRYGWKEFPDNCILEDNEGHMFPIRRKGDSLEIEAKLKSDSIVYKDGKINLYDGAEWMMIPLVMGEDGIVVKHYNEVSDEPHKIDIAKCTIEYKKIHDYRFSEWDNPPQGLLTIRVIYNEMVAKLDVYYLPSTFAKSIRRDLVNGVVIFDNRIQVKSSYLQNNHNSFKDVDYSEITDSNNPLNKYNDVISFRLGDENQYVDIDVYRPSYRKVLSFGGKPIFVSNSEDKVFSVALVNSERMDVHVIDKNGKTMIKKRNVGFYDFDEEIQWGDDNFDKVICNGDDIKYVICDDTVKYGIEKGVMHVSKEFVGEYKFYYWAVTGNSEPYEIPTTYDSEKELMYIGQEYLSKVGIIFQSLDELNPPRYWKPFISKVHKYAHFANDTETQIKCFDIANKYGIYFKIFEPLYKIVPTTERLQDATIVSFFFEYAKSKNYILSGKDYDGLYRFADEFMFDWLFLSRYAWSQIAGNDLEKRGLATELFSHNSKIKNKSIFEQVAYNQLVDTYWSKKYPSLRNPIWEPQERSVESKAIKFMNGKVDGFEFAGLSRNYTKIRTFLNELYEKDNSFQLIINKIKNEFFK